MPPTVESQLTYIEQLFIGSAAPGRGRVRSPSRLRASIAVGEVFKLGWGVEVLEPAELRAAVAKTARELAELHQDTRDPARRVL